MPGMANPENIEPHKIRSTSEAREKGRAGGLRSGARRRELASLKEAARLILSMDSASPKHNKAMELMGLDPDERTNAAAVTATMVMRAAEGDVKAYEALSKNMALLDSDRQAEREDADPAARQAPPFDLSAAIAPTFCAVSRAVEAGIQEVVLKGGRGSAKSSYAYQKQLDVFLARPNAMWLCMRRFANTLRRSCYANVLWAIRKRGMTIGRSGEDADFTASVSPMEVVYNATGQKILFSGLDDPEKLKSITFDDPRKKIEILTWEEYSQFDPADVRNVEYSVLRADYGLEFKLFNPPPDSEHWANREASDKADDPAVLVHHSTWRDVPEEFLGARFVTNAERMYRESPEAARNELDGECIELQGRVFRNVEECEVTDEEIAEFGWIRRGLDWGYETDPWVLLDVAYDRKRRELVIYGEEWRHHMLNADTAAVVKEHLAERGSDGRAIRDEATGRMMLPQEERLQFYVALKDATVYADGRPMITEYNPSLRADEDVRMLSTALQVLGKRCGFGTKYYALDESGGVATAKQVASDNAEMMRTVHKHEQIVRPAIEGIVTAAASVCRSLGGLAIPDIEGAVNVVMGDSIIQDDDSLRERDRADVAAGLLAPWRYMVRWQGYSEDEAREECGLADASSALPVEA